MILLNVMDGFCLDLKFEDDRKNFQKILVHVFWFSNLGNYPPKPEIMRVVNTEWVVEHVMWYKCNMYKQINKCMLFS